MNSDIMEAITQIAKDKRIGKDNLRDILEDIFVSMIEKRYGTSENFDVIVNIDKGDIEIYQEKMVVEEVEDPVREITLDEALKIDPDAEIGEEIVEVIDPAQFGRRLIVTAKQNLNQRIRDFEREHILEEYQNRIGEIIIGDIHQIQKRGIYINQDKTEVFLPREEMIYNERLRRGDTVRCLVKEVRNEGKGPEIIVSRADKQFLIRLFELEVPEIYDGIVEIKRVAREAGDRSKIAVESIDRRIDAVGACVGMKGVRIQAIVRELNNEKIDIVNYSSEPEIFISRALAPAKPLKILVNEEEKMAVAIIEDEQMSLAIGRGGQNLRLASELTGYQIEPIRESEYQSEGEPPKSVAVEDIEELPANLKNKLLEADVLDVSEIEELGREGLLELPGIGPKSADKILEVIQAYSPKEEEAAEESESN
ncbi:MAG TPA: transcription termination factor NusA [Caldithrix abyssi]|uniref:Transcription termination/antitermination protein NusA n=1 Tax=Caldithrix abyssi TaxID=187145 RepID=A0A7V4WU22_CALAY|nr:transcription termination factor NusA [Caldithrix abyssi]